MPHVHSMTIFGVDRIEIKFVPEQNSYSIALIEGDEKTVISIWRTPNEDEPATLIVDKSCVEKAIRENTDALRPHSQKSDR
jgi:hypothetical protein